MQSVFPVPRGLVLTCSAGCDGLCFAPLPLFPLLIPSQKPHNAFPPTHLVLFTGRVLIEISSTHKKLNESLDENFKNFHKEIIRELEKKTELDVKYMNATLKRYQAEHKNKLDSLEKSQAELKKIRRKSQGGRNALKYEHKEIEYVETITSRQNEIQKFIADGCKEALLEEKRRFCFLVDKHCSFASHMHHYHLQSAELINSKLPKWQETCGDATKVPEKIMNMIEEIKTPVSTPMSGTPLPSPMIERSSLVRTGCLRGISIVCLLI
ncbi:Brain-specific angiogenesis inhibitor 1-associated protein 2-like protein 1 [Camelus dromedarius]|uniref:Brain-specific angiogenesis inhibitor 1-associated protein 2-like protein 1 n=1 Tax=Camelus dromedarius TaxID=9838 RepID=A0A5N4CXC7_CAMDR|nr:Brain-specific angiogenesis inhibitor 1-associated protein 2-like protein 1 [Camelus dromedarius]